MNAVEIGFRDLLETIVAWGANQADPTFDPFSPAPGSRVRRNGIEGTVKTYSLYGNALVDFDNGHMIYVDPKGLQAVTLTNEVPRMTFAPSPVENGVPF